MLKTTGLVILTMMATIAAVHAQTENTLTESEKKDGWKLLYDGKTSRGWHTYNQKSFGNSWTADSGALHKLPAAGGSEMHGGDISTDKEYENFDLKYSWKIAANGNSGVMFLVHEGKEYDAPYLTGPEMQVLDNDGHPDGKIHKHRSGDLYDLIASASEPVHPVGQWNDAEIKLDHGKLSLYLNGVQTVSTTMWDPAWYQLVAGSKFKTWPAFAKYKTGHIVLQDHGSEVSFRDVKLKEL